VLLAEGDEAFATMAEAKLHQAMAAYNETSCDPFPLSASIGSVCALSGSSATLKELMAIADERMYVAKRRYKALGPGPVTRQLEKR
jgi:GGDEF domain-containing protein